MRRRLVVVFEGQFKVAKRRNPKKEKASRNKLYARQFRNKSSRNGSRRNQGGMRRAPQTDTEKTPDMEQESET